MHRSHANSLIELVVGSSKMWMEFVAVKAVIIVLQSRITNMSEDYSVPRNLTDSLFKNFQLPEKSNIQSKGANSKPYNPPHHAKYQENQDDDIINLNLTEESVIVPRGKGSNNSGKSNSTSTTQIEEESKPRTRTVGGKRGKKPGSKTNKPTPEKQQIDINGQVGEIDQWVERGAKNNSDEEDFEDAGEVVGQTAEQREIQRRLEEKIKNGFGTKRGGGLTAKAEEMKRMRLKEKEGSAEELTDCKRIENVPPGAQSSIHQTSNDQLIKGKPQQPVRQYSEERQEDDDPWDKVNQKTLQRYNDRKEKQRLLTIDLVLRYYKEEFTFDQDDIDIRDAKDNASKADEQVGCLDQLFACFKSEKKSKPEIVNNVAVAKRLIAISKTQLSNTEEEYFLLQQIWKKLTEEPFSRYGGHWNKIGFQGRDPATDLRSTGVLSLLQWLLYLSEHEKQANKYAVWSMQNDYPLALTHIKITGAFLDLLQKGNLRGESWEDFQRGYNALIMAMFKRMKSQFKGGENLGTLVEEEARRIKNDFAKELASYKSLYKK